MLLFQRHQSRVLRALRVLGVQLLFQKSVVLLDAFFDCGLYLLLVLWVQFQSNITSTQNRRIPLVARQQQTRENFGPQNLRRGGIALQKPHKAILVLGLEHRSNEQAPAGNREIRPGQAICANGLWDSRFLGILAESPGVAVPLLQQTFENGNIPLLTCLVFLAFTHTPTSILEAAE